MSTVAERLIVAQRSQQSGLAAATEQVVARLWRDLFDPKDPNGSWRQVEPLLVALVRQRQQVSAAVASNFVAAFRNSLNVSGRYIPTPAAPLVADDIVPWLRAAAPAEAVKLLNSGATDISTATLDKVNGSVIRMVLDGGRSTITTTADRDPRCIGYERHASAACCAFCAMLTGRVYRNAESAGEGRKWHLKCHCAAVPVYSRDQPPPPNSAHFGDLWATSTRGLRGNDARIAFRQAIEGRAQAELISRRP